MLGILSIKDQLKINAQWMKNAMEKDLAVSPVGAKENQDPKKMKIIIMINRTLNTNAI
jgi:hypothetical protein